ncbi:hypothetical protein [Scatolibacter rhodanostii]|uniref:hypothetical protein n=1 Tax=Scatolibacter rhodanostii TaxID=2014781 RepID=UPI000C084B78|nr:hypothetical protein [Scatolibacter rhodanostii]
MNKSNETVMLNYAGKEHKIPLDKIQEFRVHLSKIPAFKPVNIDLHISFMYSGNQLAIKEFLDWYKSNSF